ncbi:metalloprotease [Halobacteriales archaeon Cl-PHB]
MRFSRKELVDLTAAWLALGVAFLIFLNRDLVRLLLRQQTLPVDEVTTAFVLSLSTVGVGFLLHELGHKVVAIRFGQVAEFRADYGMLFLAIVAAMAGFLFAAPGAVHHRGRITKRQNGLIALAGPVVNVVLAVGFLGLALVSDGFLQELGVLGFLVNAFLGAFNMIPFGALDGRTVLDWSLTAFAAGIAAPVAMLAWWFL